MWENLAGDGQRCNTCNQGPQPGVGAADAVPDVGLRLAHISAADWRGKGCKGARSGCSQIGSPAANEPPRMWGWQPRLAQVPRTKQHAATPQTVRQLRLRLRLPSCMASLPRAQPHRTWGWQPGACGSALCCSMSAAISRCARCPVGGSGPCSSWSIRQNWSCRGRHGGQRRAYGLLVCDPTCCLAQHSRYR